MNEDARLNVDTTSVGAAIRQLVEQVRHEDDLEEAVRELAARFARSDTLVGSEQLLALSMCTGEVWPSGLGLPQGARSLLPPGLLGTVEAQEIPLETLDGSFAQLGARPTEEAAGWRARRRGLHSPSRIDFDDFDMLPGG